MTTKDLIQEMIDVLTQCQAQLGDLVREGKATDDDRECYEAVKEVLARAENVEVGK